MRVLRREERNIAEIARELGLLLRSYAEQETLEPVKQILRYLGYGAGGMALISFGVFFLALSALRAMQSQTDAFDGGWSFAPYLIVAVGLLMVIGFAYFRIRRGWGEHRRAG
jgi:hypothetical protein